MDTPVQRVTREYMSSLVCGELQDVYGRAVDGWTSGIDIYVEPLAKTLMLAPMVTRPAWDTSFTGINARMRLTDWTLSESALWKEEQVRDAGDYYFQGDALTSDSNGITTASYAKNRGWFVSFFTYAGLDTDYPILEVGWGATVGSDAAGTVRLEFWRSGKVDVYKAGVLVSTGTYSGAQGRQSSDNKQTQLLLIPCRFRELLIIGLNVGGGHRVAFGDIEDGASEPAIVPAGKFWFRVPLGGSSKLQLAPLTFPSIGYANGAVTLWKKPPETGTTIYKGTRSSLPYYGTNAVTTNFVKPDGTAFVPDGVEREGYIQLVLTGDGASTRFPLFSRAWVFPTVDNTADESQPLYNYTRALTLSFEEDIEQSAVTAEIVNPRGAEADVPIPDLLNQSNRPVTLYDNPEVGGLDPLVKLMDMAMSAPEIQDGANAEAEVMQFRGMPEIVRVLQQTRFDDLIPFDGMQLEDVFGHVCEAAGLTSDDYECSVSGFTMSSGGSPSQGEFGPQVEARSTALEFLKQLHQDYCATWFFGLEWDAGSTYGMKVVLKDPADLESTPAIDMYLDQATADAALTPDAYNPNVFYEWKRGFIEPEANDIWVVGFDSQARRPILVHKADTASQDPTTAVASRPDNWLGEIRKYGLQQRQFTSQELCERAAEILFARLTVRKRIRWAKGPAMVDGDGKLLLPGRLIRVWEDGAWAEYRINSARITSLAEHDVFGSPVREGDYVLEYHDGASGGYLGIPHGSPAEIGRARRTGARKVARIIRFGSEFLTNLAPSRVTDL